MPTIQLQRGPGGGGGPGCVLYGPGLALVGLGVAILLFEDLLRFAVAGLLIAFGALLLGAARQMGRGGGPPGGFAMFAERFRR